MKVHVKCKVGLQAFEKLKPYYVHHMRMQVSYRNGGINTMQTTSKGIHGRMCNCNYDIYYFETPWHYIVE